MSERGVFAVDRGIWDHVSFAKEAFTEREAFMWLVGEASYRARRVRVGSTIVELGRGQLAHSLRFMADKWQWKEPRVRRFLGRLKIDAVIDADSDAGTTRVTICNYDKYQRVSLPSDAPADADSDAGTTQQRRKVEDKENKEIPSETSSLREPRAERALDKPAKKSPAKRPHRLPSDWWPDDELRAYARDRLPGNRACQDETEKFKNYWAAAGGKNAAKLDWNLTYKNWILTAAKSYGDEAAQPRNGFAGPMRSGPTGSRDAPRRQSPNDRLVEGLWSVMEHLPDDA